MDKTTVQDALTHLSALGFIEGDTVYMNCLSPSLKIEFIYPDLPLTSIKKAESLGRNIFFAPNKGGYENKDIAECQVLFYEHDDLDKEVSANLWESIGLPQPTIQVDTGNKSVHTYYVLSEPISPELFREAQTLLSTHLKSDKSLKNPARLMRLCGGIHPKTGEVSTFYSHSGINYTIDDLLPILQSYKASRSKAKPTTQTPIDDIEEARQALRAITSFEFIDSEEHWHRIGMSCKYISESLFDDWVAWSWGSPDKASKTNFKERWDSWKGAGIKRATLFMYAKDCGYRSANPKYQPNSSGNFDHLDEVEVIDNPFNRAVKAVIEQYDKSIAYNTLTNRHEFEGKKKTVNEIISHIKMNTNILLPRWDAPLIVDYVAKQNSYNPIIEYLKSCKTSSDVTYTNIASKYWNGTKQEDEYFSLFLRAAVLRQINEDKPVDFPFVLVMIGDSSCGKTATFELLFDGYYHYMTRFGTEDTNSALTKSWLCLWDEMIPVLDPRNRDMINTFITKKYFSYNVMYVSKDEQKPTPFVIGGTTTDYQFLSDSYSQRRWMVCKVPTGTKVNINQLQKDVDAIWASAYQSVLNNPSLGSFTSLIEETTKENKQYVSRSEYYSIIATAAKAYMNLTGYDFVHVSSLIEFMWEKKQGLPPKDFKNEVKSILYDLGYRSTKYKRVPFRDERVWRLDPLLDKDCE